MNNNQMNPDPELALILKLNIDPLAKDIFNTINTWDFKSNGNITQVKVAKQLKVGKTYVSNRWNMFKAESKRLNNLNK